MKAENLAPKPLSNKKTIQLQDVLDDFLSFLLKIKWISLQPSRSILFPFQKILPFIKWLLFILF